MRLNGRGLSRYSAALFLMCAGLFFALPMDLAAAPAAPAAAPRLDDWIVVGPGGGGGQFYPTISPHDPNVAMVRCDMTGSFITHDAGKSWRMFNLRGTSDFFVFDPVDPNVMYAMNVGLYRSADAGRTWNLVYPKPEQLDKFLIAGDHGEVGIMIKDVEPFLAPREIGGRRVGPAARRNVKPLTALAVDPSDSKKLFACIGRGKDSGLFVSSDWGGSWEKLGMLPGQGRKIFVDASSPEDSRKVYVICANSVSVLIDGKLHDFSPPPGASRLSDVSGGFDAKTGSFIVYAISASWNRETRVLKSFIYVSTNGGRTWSDKSTGLKALAAEGSPDPRYRSLGACLSNGNVAYVSYMNLADPTDGKKYFGVAKTTNAGRTWKLVWKESDKIGKNMKPGWMSLRFGPGWGENPISIGVAPGDSNVVLTTDYGRTMRTLDGGATWEPVYSRKMPDGGWTTTGLDVTTCYGVHFDPFDKKRVFISYTDIGLFASSDGGATWESATTQGFPDRWVNTTYWMEFDPEVKGKVWAVAASVHDLPRPKMWRRRGRVGQRGGVVVSEDGARTWKPVSSDMGEASVTHILLDPKSPKESRTLYVAGYGTGVWKSTDGGASWTLKNNGIDGDDPFAWRLSRDSAGALYLVVARKSEDGSHGNEGDGALYRSADGAETWEKLVLPEGLNGPNALTVDPDDPKRLYLSVWGRYKSDGAVTGGIWLSTDAGKSWKNALSDDQYIYDVTVSPHDHNVLFACGFSSSAWRSDDRGKSWKRIKGYNFKWGHRVVPDPYDAEMIYVTTFGGSVWYGPAAGDPDATDDIVTPAAKY